MPLATREVEQVEHLHGVDAEYRSMVGPVGRRHVGQQPLRGGNAALRTAGRCVIWHDHARAVAQQLQRVAGDAVEWLDAALVHYRECTRCRPMCGVVGRLSHTG